MKRCSDYEIELSALLDGESDPAMALTLVGHVAECSECSSCVRELSSSQKIIDSLQIVPATKTDAAVFAPSVRKRPLLFGLRPQWAVGLAAALVLAVSVWFGNVFGTSAGLTNDLRDGELVIRLEEDKGRMSEERFVAIVSELLRADRRFQNEMYVVLDEITFNRESGELRSSDSPDRTGERGDSDWTEVSPPVTAAMK
jgi:hypothetical protein